jgi:GcrA cell cycle regulator
LGSRFDWVRNDLDGETLMSWTDERVELLTKLWADGLSASQIATELGGVTRNAVIGKVHRLGLSGRVKSTSSQPKPRRPRAPSHPMRTSRAPRTIGNTALKVEVDAVAAPVVRPRPAIVEELFIPPEQRATILSLTENICKWPIGDPSSDDFYFCGDQSDSGVPYCQHHARVAYQPINERRRDRRAQKS